MSTTTETTLETTIRIDPVPGRGRRRVRVAVMHGETAVHLDTVEIDNARSRTAFIAAAEERAAAAGHHAESRQRSRMPCCKTQCKPSLLRPRRRRARRQR